MQSSFLSPEAISLMSGMPMAEPPPDYRLPDRFPDLTREKRIAIDIETSDPDLKTKGPGPRRDGYIVGVSIATDGGFAEYMPVAHTVGQNLDRDKVFEYLNDQLSFFTGEVVGANLLYDWDFLSYQNIAAPMARFRDVQFDEALVDEAAPSYSLNALAQKYLGETKVTDELKELYGKEYIARFRDIHPGHARAYGLGDVTLPLRISTEQKKELKKQGLVRLSDLEHRQFPFLLYLKRTGVKIDLPRAEELSTKFGTWVRRRLERASHFSDASITYDNFGKLEYLAGILTQLGANVPRTDKGNISITDAWLKALDKGIETVSQRRAFGKQIAGANKFDKSKETFIDNFVFDFIVGDRLYPSFHPLRRVEDEGNARGTVSGRYSCTDPNCFDGKTEVLTKDGWTRFDALERGKPVAQWDDGTITFVTPTHYQFAPDSEFLWLHNDSTDLAVTPDHRCPLIHRKTGTQKDYPAKDYPEDYKQVHAGMYAGPGLAISPAMLHFICALQADAYWDRGAAEFTFKKERKIKRLVGILETLSVPFSINPKGECTRIRVSADCALLSDAKQYLGVDGKHFGNWILELNPEQLDDFCHEVIQWDGCVTRNNHYGSKFKSNSDWVQTAHVLRGMRAKVRIYSWVHERIPAHSLNYVVDVVRKSYGMTTNIERKPLPKQDAYCLSVPSTYILVRRNGKVSVSGQCQQIPARDPIIGPLCRSMFIPENGYQWASLDWSQIEYRFLIHEALVRECTGADVPQKMYQTNPDTDFHKAVAEMTGLRRKDAKNINFALVYGAGVRKLAQGLGLIDAEGNPLPKALEIMDTYHERAPFIREVMDKVSHEAQTKGYVKTILGRRSRFTLWEPEFSEKGTQRQIALPRAQAEAAYGKQIKVAYTHKALNRVLQGSAADLSKLALVKIWEAGLLNSPNLICHLIVHDEFDFSVAPNRDGEERLREAQNIMETAMLLRVPVKASKGVGKNWSEAH